MMNRRALYLSDLMTGIFAALALRKEKVLSLRGNRFDQALEQLQNAVKEAATQNELDVRFRIRTHPIHGDSTLVQQAIYEAAQRDLVSLDNPEYQDIRLKISAQDAPGYLHGLPGNPEMYQHLAEKLLSLYYYPTPA